MILRVILFFLFVSCSSEPTPPRLNYLIPTDTILAFGDSLTSGYGAGAGESYADYLARQTGRRVLRSGVKGETTAGGLARLAGVLDQNKPKLLILCEGGNDFLRSVPQAEVKKNLGKMIQMAKDRGIDVVLVGVPKSHSKLVAPPLYQELAEEFSIPLENEVLSQIGKNGALLADPIHPNAAGYKTMAKAIYEVLKKYAAVE